MITEQQNFNIEMKEKSDYKPLPEGIYQVELFDINVKSVETYDSKKSVDTPKEFENVFDIQYVLLNGVDGEDKLRGRNVWHNFIPSYLYIGKNGKNSLYQVIESFLGRDLKEEEIATFDAVKMNKLVGKQARVTVKNKVSGDKTYSNISEYFKVEQEMEGLTAEEKDAAKVKPKDDAKKEDTSTHQAYQKDDVPTIQIEEEEEVKIEDVPF